MRIWISGILLKFKNIVNAVLKLLRILLYFNCAYNDIFNAFRLVLLHRLIIFYNVYLLIIKLFTIIIIIYLYGNGLIDRLRRESFFAYNDLSLNLNITNLLQ